MQPNLNNGRRTELQNCIELKEQNSISYEWHLSADGNEATLIESFIDSDSMMVRLANHGASPLASEVFEHVDITSVLCLGNAKPDAIDTLSAWAQNFMHTTAVTIEVKCRSSLIHWLGD